MRIRRSRRAHGAAAPPTSGRHGWIAAALVVAVLLAMAIWIGIELSDWPPPPQETAEHSGTQ